MRAKFGATSYPDYMKPWETVDGLSKQLEGGFEVANVDETMAAVSDVQIQ